MLFVAVLRRVIEEDELPVVGGAHDDDRLDGWAQSRPEALNLVIKLSSQACNSNTPPQPME